MADFTTQDEGKPVTLDGETVGTVVIGDDDTAYVDPSADAPDRVLAKLDWGDRDDRLYPLDETEIDAITDDEVLLRTDL
ncbi:PRC-barrel domain containing protein [Halorussus sp. MSC15.2]|uniref:PRC-barrel domain containing protein n=1 Tax=Halorussus sp. MSC15.2 TaxID=2283638 RepID=UPI0013D12F88|nr:PRC-barrel domain containing protein [Halorussus sp. MSC15.2]NEU58372.1 PRC-barrel domain containing protein [Halorussus sp. MSC15.2]